MRKENMFGTKDVLGNEKDYSAGYEDGYGEGVENGIMTERRAHRRWDIFLTIMVILSLFVSLANTAYMFGYI